MVEGHYGVKPGVDPLAWVTTSHLVHIIDISMCAVTNEQAQDKDVSSLKDHLRVQLYSLKLRLKEVGVFIDIAAE